MAEIFKMHVTANIDILYSNRTVSRLIVLELLTVLLEYIDLFM